MFDSSISGIFIVGCCLGVHLCQLRVRYLLHHLAHYPCQGYGRDDVKQETCINIASPTDGYEYLSYQGMDNEEGGTDASHPLQPSVQARRKGTHKVDRGHTENGRHHTPAIEAATQGKDNRPQQHGQQGMLPLL